MDLASLSSADLFAGARNGNRAALARLLSLIERNDDEARVIGRLTSPLSGTAYTVGITGAPGAGKSTLTSGVIGHIRSLGLEVAVLAIDPSSPFTGGAILGDRVRMQDHATDPGVFIRSFATRGHLGGLSLSTPEAIRLLDAVGHRWILIETVGVGQVEVEVAGKADTTVVVVNPGWGDVIQANKAGLMEIADIFVINKSDRPGAEQTRHDLDTMLDLTGAPGTGSIIGSTSGWRPPIVSTIGTTASGVIDLWDAVCAHREFITANGELVARRGRRSREELHDIVIKRLEQRALAVRGDERWNELQRAVVDHDIDPWTAADELFSGIDGDDG